MFEALIVTTSTAGLSAIGTREQRSFELITDTVRERLGEAHAALFAEPVATEQGDRYDWYAQTAGAVRRRDSLDEDARALLDARLETLTSDIRALARDIAEAGDADALRLGEALENALRVPGDEFVYAIGEGPELQPVLVNWSWASDAQKPQRGQLTAAARVPPPVSPAAPGPGTHEGKSAALAGATAAAARPARGGGAWWLLLLLGWLILAAMLAAIVLLMVPACALKGPFWLSFCPPPAASASAERAQLLVLQDQIDQVERRIAIADRACQPPPPVRESRAAPPAAPPVPARTAVDEILDEAGAQRGDLTFSLIWNGPSDVDLAVTCPTGARIWYGSKTACGGTLDVDSNAATIRDRPVENIFFRNPPSGTYRVAVTLFKDRTAVRDDFRLVIRDGARTRTETGRLLTKGQSWTTTINYPGSR